MRIRGRATVLLGMALCLLGTGCRTASIPVPSPPSMELDTGGQTERGEYIVRNVAVCGHCHAASPQRDPDGPLSGGMEFKNWRLGIARASNLTSDPETGLGTWT